MLCYVLLLLKCIIFISLVCQWNFEFQSCCLKHSQLLCLWYFYVIIQVMNMQWYDKKNVLNKNFSSADEFFGLFWAIVLPVVMSAAYDRSSRTNTQFIFIEGFTRCVPLFSEYLYILFISLRWIFSIFPLVNLGMNMFYICLPVVWTI